ncbi:MAG: protein-L-isoaspartate(D-aspartate) O-methyltransferase [Pirellulaceae bacterium]|nr:protein-L-isoaspartate(D-aspartate) O-methyltransferase [Pirellulaceae bacterium]
MNFATNGAPDRQASLRVRRLEMVEKQLRLRGINDERVIQAMLEVPREKFVPERLRDSAYDDCALPIEANQTISQPFTVAFMCQAVGLQGGESVLEVGTGSGYSAAVLACLARNVYSVERVDELFQTASTRLERLRCRNVQVKLDDGTLGWQEFGPFDAILVTAGGVQLPEPLGKQLKEGGRLVMPIGRSRTSQTMYRYIRLGEGFQREELGRFRFVPLIGTHGWEPN